MLNKNIDTIVFDFDEVIVETIRAFNTITMARYKMNVLLAKKYNFSDVCPQGVDIKDVLSIFDEQEFVDALEFKPNVLEVIKELSKDFKIKIVTIGTYQNLIRKEMWFRDQLKTLGLYHLNNEIEWVGLEVSDTGFKPNKSTVDMSTSLHIDDNQDCLFSSNAQIKVLFENVENAEWNNQWEGYFINDITELYKFVI